MASHSQSPPFDGKGYVGVDYGFNLYLEALMLYNDLRLVWQGLRGSYFSHIVADGAKADEFFYKKKLALSALGCLRKIEKEELMYTVQKLEKVVLGALSVNP